MSGLPFTDMYRSSGRLEDQLLPISTSNSGAGGNMGGGAGGGSGGLGALARSASLSARKKDPYTYSSDDVESGLGNMDVSGERGWGMGMGGQGGPPGGAYQGGPGFGAGGYGHGRDQMGQTQFPFSNAGANPPGSAGISGRSPLAPTHMPRSSMSANTGGMHPPPPPLALHTRPTGSRADSGGSASSAGPPGGLDAQMPYSARPHSQSQTQLQSSPYTPAAAHMQAQQAQAYAKAQAQALANAQAQAVQAQHGQTQQTPYNPYIPLGTSRGADPASAPPPTISAGGAMGADRDTTWEYRSIVPPRERIPSSSSHHSHYSELSPFSHPDPRLPSPSSPMLNPYEPYPSTPGSAGMGGYYANSSSRQGSMGQHAQGQMQGHGAIGEERKDSSASQHRQSSSSRSHSQSNAPSQGMLLASSSPMSNSGSGMNTPWSAYAPSPDGLAPLVPPQQAQLPHQSQAQADPPSRTLQQQRPNGSRSQSSHMTATHAASQPVTPANKYSRAPPQTATGAYGAQGGAGDEDMEANGRVSQGSRGRQGQQGYEQDKLQPQQYQQQQMQRRSSRSDLREQGLREQGLREINDLSELVPIRNEKPVGRRADPMRPGKFISPLQCLTSDLAQTYTLCNPQFRYESSDNPRRVLTKPSKPVHNDGADNEDWDYILYVNDILGGEGGGDRYLILDVLGQGTFGQVVKCQNFRTHDIVAVKVVKNKPAYLNQSKMEVAILDLLNNQYDPHDQHHILRMLDSFTHKNHLCLVFECLSSNLYELIKQNNFKGLSLQLVKVFTGQLLECLAVLKDARLIHCDLKPENILLKSLQSPQIKIIDFGSACHEMQTVYTYIQSRFYRSPEVLLGLPYSTSIDMWSLGCIVVELFLGLPLFPGTSEYNQLSRIVDMLGNPPSHLLEVGKQTNEFYRVAFDNHGRKAYELKSMEQYATEHRTNEQPSKQYFKQTKLDDIIMQYPLSKKNPKQSDMDKEMNQRTAFVDFVKGLINLDPIKRWSPQQAAKHPFLTGDKFTGPYQPSANPVHAKKSAHSSPMASPTTPSRKSYGNLSQSHHSSPSRNNRIYSDAGTYTQTNQASAYTPQTARPPAEQGSAPYSPTSYEQNRTRMPSQTHSAQPPPPQPQWQSMGPPANYQARMPSQNMGASASHGQLRPSGMGQAQGMGAGVTNPPPNSYYPATRNRANTINQMDAIPPALARLTHMSMPDPSGQRNLTPVLNRGDDAYREWERRQQGGLSKNSSLAQASYPQLEYLQEQAELAAMSGGWMMPPPAHTHNRQPGPGQGMGMGGMYAPPPTSYGQGGHTPGGGGSYGGAGHRTRPSGQTSQGQYQMQPPIPPQQPPTQSNAASMAASRYDPPGNRAYLPTFPPPAATTSHSHSHSNSFSGAQGPYDAYDVNQGGPPKQMMYTPIQTNIPHTPMGQASPYGAGPGPSSQTQGPGHGYGTQGLGIMGHQTRSSFSGPFSPAGPQQGQSQNPFVQQQGMGGQVRGQGQGGSSPRYQRRSQQYGV